MGVFSGNKTGFARPGHKYYLNLKSHLSIRLITLSSLHGSTSVDLSTIKLESCLSVCLHSFLVRLITLPYLYGLTSDLLDTIAMSSEITKFVFASF